MFIYNLIVFLKDSYLQQKTWVIYLYINKIYNLIVILIDMLLNAKDLDSMFIYTSIVFFKNMLLITKHLD